MKICYSLLLFLLYACPNILGQDLPMNRVPKPRVILSGTVSDSKTGSVLAGASIFFPDAKTGAIADEHGHYRITNIPAGKHLVEVSYLGHASIIEQIELNGNIERNFSLMPSVTETEAVTVTGVSAATSVRRTPIPVSIISKSDLFANPSTNIVDALTKIPGVTQLSTGPVISKPIIRGLGYNRVVVVNDGIRQEGQQWGDEHGIEIDEYNVSRAEVLKGPASIMYGSDALAGVVNFISFAPPPESTLKGNIFTSYQTNNRQRGLHFDLAGNNRGFVWGLYGSLKLAADYKNKYDGYVFNSKLREGNYGGYLGVNKGWGFTHLYYTEFNQRVGIVEGERDPFTGEFLKLLNQNGSEQEVLATDEDSKSAHPFIPMQQIRHTKLVVDNNFKIGKQRLAVTLGLQRNERQEYGYVLDPKEESLFFDLKTINYNIQYHLDERNGWKTSLGVNGMHQRNDNKGVEVLIPEYSLFDIGGFVFAQKRYEKLTLSAGARFDNRSINTDRYEEAGNLKFLHLKKDFANFSASIGFSYETSKMLTLKLNIARGFRSPSIPELTSNGAHEGTNRFEFGEADLKSETSFQVDGGLTLNTEHLSFDLNLFYNALNNFIYYRRLVSSNGSDSTILQNGEEFFAFRFDQQNVHLYGAEMNLDIHPHPLDWLHIENSFSFVRGVLSKEQDGSKNLPSIPAARVLSEIRGVFYEKAKTVRNFYINFQIDNTFSKNKPFTGFNSETKTSGYSLLNAGLGWQFVNGNGNTLVSIALSANNLTNLAYQNHLSRLKYGPQNNSNGRRGVFNMGRNFCLKLNIPFNTTVDYHKE